MSDGESIYALLVDPKTGLGALVAGQKALHARLDTFMVHCGDTHAAIRGGEAAKDVQAAAKDVQAAAVEAALTLRVTALETKGLVANGVSRGRLEVIMLVAKIAALMGVGSGGIAALVAVVKMCIGGQ